VFRKGFINTEDLKEVFALLGENVSDDEVNSKPSLPLTSIAMIKIAGVKSNDKINFKEFVDFFYKID
jgi:Ca2+-binding EF-hand superfamily protein